jgi:Phage portal protein
MGFISNLTEGRNIWQEVFGNATGRDKEKFPSVHPGGSWGRGIVSEPAAYKRLLQAMRSMAPGGWSDDRWEQWRHWTGITYLAGHRACEQLSQAEFEVFEKDDNSEDGKRPVRRGHVGYDLIRLLEKPNREDSFGDIMYWISQQMDLTGTALLWMVPDGLSVPKELYVIPTATAIPQPAINPDYPDGYYRIQPVYPYGPFSTYPTPTTAVGAPLPAQWVVRIKYPHPLLRYDGWSPLTALRLHLDEIESIDRSRWYKMKRTINPSATLDLSEMEGYEGSLPRPEIERIQTEFEALLQGPENVGRLFVPPPGGKLVPWDAAMEVEYKEGWAQLVDFAMAALGTPKGAAGMEAVGGYGQFFAMLKAWHAFSLNPKCARIGAKLTRFVAPFFGDDLIVEVRCPRINDHEVVNAEIDKAVQAKAITKGEVRRALESLRLKTLNAEWENDIAGDPSPNEKAQQEQQMAAAQAPGMPGDGSEGAEAPAAPETGADNGPGTPPPQPPELETSRPKAGKLAAGSLGPRGKNLIFNGYQKRLRLGV